MKPTFETVMAALIAGYHDVTLSDGRVLTATDKTFADDAVNPAQLPFLSLQEGTWTSSDWQAWQHYIVWDIPGVLYIPVDYLDDGAARLRAVLADLYQINSMIKGLPVDEDGNLVRYTSDTAAMFDDGTLTVLVDRTGPTIKGGTATRDRNKPFAKVALRFGCEFVLDVDPRTFSYAKVVAVGLTPVDVSRQQWVPPGWAPQDVPRLGDVHGTGQFSSAPPSVALPVTKVPIPYTAGPDPSTTLARIVVTPQNCALTNPVTQQFVATARYLDGGAANITAAVTWGSSAPSVATIAATGLLTTVGAGTSNITAAFESHTSNAVSVAVS